MKSLRRSFNKDPPPISTPISTYPALSKPIPFAQPPQKVIRCIAPYRAQRPQELSCAVGDFLYVIRDVDPSNDQGWYEATNPSNNGRGVVPKAYFEELPKPGPPSIPAGPNARLPSGAYNRTSAADPTLKKPSVKHQTFYAIVQYDFNAERPDELEAKAGEPISVVAQSNREWFVAKPIGRLGGPGLIPVSFVEIRDPVTNQAVKDVDILMDKGILPRVEEWKQATAEYKASSIPLGVLEESNEVVKDSPFMKHASQPAPPSGLPSWSNYQPPQQQVNQPPPQHQRSQSQAQSFATNHSRALSRADPEPGPEPQNAPDAAPEEMLPPGTILSATIPSFHYENNEYWFRLDVMYQPAESPAKALQLVLYRNYDDFYDFQISLLDAFPVEAGRVPDKQHNHGYPTPPSSVEETSTRILPYMPGPVSFVDDMITSVRRTELDQYLEELLQLESQGHGHILKHPLFRSFLYPKSGDIMEETDAPAPSERTSVAHNAGYGNDTYDQDQDEVAEDMNRMHIGERSNSSEGRPSNDAYDNYQSNGPSRSGYSPPQGGNDYDRNSNGGRYSGADYGAGRSGKNGSASPPKGPYSRSRLDDDSRPGSYADGHIPASTTSSYYDTPSATSSHIRQQSHATLSPPLNQHPYGAQGGNAGGSRSARSSAGPNDIAASPNPSEGGSASGAPPAFLKIKIFHSESDDLIAIRVPPRVTYSQLIAKVRDRLGSAISVLRYRESYDGSKSWREIGGDSELRDWLSKGDKLVLYAD